MELEELGLNQKQVRFVEDKLARILLFKGCIRLWGARSQIDMIIEEIGEFLTTAMHFNRNTKTVSRAELLDEIVDNQITFEQAPIIYNFSEEEVATAKEAKLQRLCARYTEENRRLLNHKKQKYP